MTLDTGAPAPGRPRVLLTDFAWPDIELERSICDAGGLDLVAGPSRAGTEAEIEALVRAHDPVAILTCWAPVSAAAIDAPPNLRIVQRMGVGLDNIAVSAATARGAWVANVPDYCVEEVSDHAVALMLAALRGIGRLDAMVKSGLWDASAAPPLARIASLTVGVVGFGRIGRATARKLAGFGCTILASDPAASAAPDGVRLVPIEMLQREADVIILHLPLVAATRNFVDSAFIANCARRPLLVNVSRGGLVENAALLQALDEGRLRGAALDVIEGEPAPPAEITSRADVVATPHVAFLSDASLIELRRRACEEVVRVLAGERPRNPCNVPQPREIPLDGGVSSDIRLIVAADGTRSVVKAAMPKLRVDADWRSDPSRSMVEVEALKVMAELLGPECVPTVLWADPKANRFAMSEVPPRLRNWKAELMAGRIDFRTARRAGALLGQLHARSSRRPDLAERFADLTFFEELRVVPYFRRAAERNPAVADALGTVIDGIARRRSALVHGDFSPKNILAEGDELVLLDCEVAHWGDPRFDLAFGMTHLLLKLSRRSADATALAELARHLVAGYREHGPAETLDSDLAPVLGALILARLDGSSPIEYLGEICVPSVKTLAAYLLTGSPGSPEDCVEAALAARRTSAAGATPDDCRG